MKPYGGFDHNAQSLRIVTRLERRYADFDGLNLSWETLEGLVKHNGPMIERSGEPTARYREHGIAPAILDYQKVQDLELASFASAEAQAAAIADDIAYNAHDIDDGLRAGLFTLEDLSSVPLIAALRSEITARHPGLDRARTTHELVRRLITRMVEDVIEGASAEFRSGFFRSADDVRQAGRALVGFSAAMTEADRSIKAFLYPNMYRHKRVMRVRIAAAAVVSDLFERLFADLSLLPEEWRSGLDADDVHRRARRVADYIAGMTDTFALEEHRRMFDTTPDLR